MRTHALLAQLALAAGPVLRGDLARAQLPDETVTDARRQVSQRLFQLRRAVPELPLRTEFDAVTLEPAERWVDVEALRASASRDDLDARIRALRRYRGPLLADTDGDWVAVRRRELEDEYIALARETVRRLLQRRRTEEAVPLLRRLVEDHPLAEQDVTQLSEVLEGLGRRDEALDVLERFSATMRDLGIQPRARTLQLAAEIRAGGPGGMALPEASGAEDPGERPADSVADAARRGDFRYAASRIRALRRAGAAPSEVLLARAGLALARDQLDRAEERLGALQDDDPRVLLLRARLARNRFDGAAASAHAADALIASGLESDDGDRFEALLELAKARGVAGQGRRALESADAALALARQSGVPTRVTRALAARGQELHRQGRYDDTRPLLTDALALAEQQGLVLTAAHVHHHLGTLANLQADLRRASDLQERELVRWRDLALDRFEVVALTDLCSTRLKLGDLDAALEIAAHALTLADTVDHPVARARARLMQAWALLSADDERLSEPRRLTDEGLALLADVAQEVWETGALLVLRGYVRLAQGEPAAGLADADASIACWERRGEPELIPRALAARGLCLARLGRTEEAVEATQEAVLTVLERTAEDDHVAIFHHLHGTVLAQAGRHDDGRRHVTHAWRLLRDLLVGLEPGERRGLLCRDPATRGLVRTVREWGIADPDEILDAPSSAADDAPPVHGAPPGAYTPSGVSRRRAELARLLGGATAEGLARPNVAELARRLGVSQRTVKRDLAALRTRDGPGAGSG